MNFVNSELDINLHLAENIVNILVVEQPDMLRGIIEALLLQMEGSDGTFVLSHDQKPISISKYVDFVFNPFSIDFASRKIQTKLFSIIKAYADTNLIEETGDLNRQILSYLDLALAQTPFSVGYNLEMDFQALIKMYHVGFQNQENEFIENIIEYLRILSLLLDINTVFFYNLKMLLSESDIIKVYEFAFYSKINIVLIENTIKSKLNMEVVTIIDSDRCIFKY